MAEIRLRERSVSEIVDAAFQLYRRDALQYIVIAALAYAPWLIVQLVVLPVLAAPATRGNVMSSGLVAIGVGLGTWVTAALMSAVIVKLGSRAYLGEPGANDIGAAVRDVLPRVPAVLLGGFLKYLLMIVGLLCFLVGVLYVFARYFAVATSIVLEGKGAVGALARSSELSKGRKRHILNTLLLVGIIYFFLSLGATVLARMTGSTVVMLVVSTGFTIVAYPVVGLTEMVLYYDARIRAEGFDIEMMTRGLGPASPGT